MSKSVNIDTSNPDPCYRYKMPLLVTKFEGKGNGARTAILNIREVAKALHCDLVYLIKFFGMELGAQAKMDKIKNKTVINGFHDAKQLALLLDKFITLFILCPRCKLPETALSVHKKAVVTTCAACGYNGPSANQHKFAMFIAKNPPKPAKNIAARVTFQVVPTALAAETKEEAAAPEPDLDWATDTSAEAVAARKAEAMGIVPTALEMATIMYADDPRRFVERIKQDPTNLPPQADILVFLASAFATHDELGSRALFILNSLYEADILEEEQILEWWEASSTADLQVEGIRKFVEWLKEADEDDSDA